MVVDVGVGEGGKTYPSRRRALRWSCIARWTALGLDHTAFKVTGAMVQDNPDDLAQFMCHRPDGFVVSLMQELSKHDLEVTSFSAGGGMGHLAQHAANLAVAFRATAGVVFSGRTDFQASAPPVGAVGDSDLESSPALGRFVIGPSSFNKGSGSGCSLSSRAPSHSSTEKTIWVPASTLGSCSKSRLFTCTGARAGITLIQIASAYARSSLKGPGFVDWAKTFRRAGQIFHCEKKRRMMTL